jgi:dTDP-4-dehydrorhamnose 3,5-epimerase
LIKKFKFEETRLKGAYIIEPFISEDDRGMFIKDYSQELFKDNAINHDLKEVFYTTSKKGVIRAIHFQKIKQQPKLVRCIYGEIFDVIVDLRNESPTFGEWEGFYLSGNKPKSLFIPAGFGHGYLVIEDAIVSYKCGEKFYPEYDDGILWNDKDINIEWPLSLVGEVILSEKDKVLQSFSKYISSVNNISKK